MLRLAFCGETERSSDMKIWLLLTFAVLMSAAAASAATAAKTDKPGSGLSAQVALDWNANAIAAIRAATTLDGQPAGAAARSFYQSEGNIYMAYVQAAVYDAVRKIAHRYEPYHHISVGAGNASAEAATVSAAYNTLTFYLGDADGSLAAKYAASIAALPSDKSTERGIAVGQVAASDIEALRAFDGRNAATAAYGVPGPVVAGAWQVVPPFAVAQTPWIAFMQPFLIDSPSQFRAPAPPALTSAEYAADLNETARMGSSTAPTSVRSPTQTAVAIFWTGSAIAQQNQGYRDEAVKNSMDLVDAVRLLAMGGLTTADASIACFDSKYHYLRWRPYTAIRNADIDGNAATAADPQWAPLLPTPNHPEYPSAHGCATSASTDSIAEALGTDAIDLTEVGASTIGGPNNATQHFATVGDLQNQLLDARVWGGLHYRTSDVNGEVLGNSLAHWVFQRYFRPVSDGD